MDPNALSAQWREQMEGLFVKGMEEMVRNTRTLQDMGRTVEAGLEGKRVADAAMKQYLEALNVPTREDTARILQYLQQIESRLLEVEERVDEVLDQLRPRSEQEEAESPGTDWPLDSGEAPTPAVARPESVVMGSSKPVAKTVKKPGPSEKKRLAAKGAKTKGRARKGGRA